MASKPKWNTRFSLHFTVAIAKFVWKMQKTIWYYEKRGGRYASFTPLRPSVKTVT